MRGNFLELVKIVHTVGPQPLLFHEKLIKSLPLHYTIFFLFRYALFFIKRKGSTFGVKGMSEKSEVCFKCGEPGASVKLTQRGTGQVVYMEQDVMFIPFLP
jgi:hypothetical protein